MDIVAFGLHACHEGAGAREISHCGRRRAAFQRDRLRGVRGGCNPDRETRANINGGVFTVPPALGNKIIHPYSDFLLHDIGTGDGIPVLPQFASTANQIRTAPLWALRTRNRLMHEGLSFTKQEAIQRHQGQAADVTTA